MFDTVITTQNIHISTFFPYIHTKNKQGSRNPSQRPLDAHAPGAHFILFSTSSRSRGGRAWVTTRIPHHTHHHHRFKHTSLRTTRLTSSDTHPTWHRWLDRARDPTRPVPTGPDPTRPDPSRPDREGGREKSSVPPASPGDAGRAVGGGRSASRACASRTRARGRVDARTREDIYPIVRSRARPSRRARARTHKRRGA